jgi:endonuclease YncB( thermonuclease family)
VDPFVRWRSVGYEWAAVLLLLGVLLAIHTFKPEWTGITMGPTSTAQRSYVAIDGDSFRAGDVEVRLHGIDAPEYRQTCRDGGGSVACGKLARDALSKLLRGREVRCSIIERDRYGRQVSVCRDGDRDINREMVRQGWAIAYRRHAQAYVSAEREARLARRGIWAWDFEMPEDFRNRAVKGNAVGEE